jgi:hypothetical protein
MNTPSKPQSAENRMLGGAFILEEENSFFCVWAYRPITDQELTMTYQSWNSNRDKRRSIRNKQIDMISNLGIS